MGEGWVFSCLEDQCGVRGTILWKILFNESEITSVGNDNAVSFELLQFVLCGYLVLHCIVETKEFYL